MPPPSSRSPPHCSVSLLAPLSARIAAGCRQAPPPGRRATLARAAARVGTRERVVREELSLLGAAAPAEAALSRRPELRHSVGPQRHRPPDRNAAFNPPVVAQRGNIPSAAVPPKHQARENHSLAGTVLVREHAAYGLANCPETYAEMWLDHRRAGSRTGAHLLARNFGSIEIEWGMSRPTKIGCSIWDRKCQWASSPRTQSAFMSATSIGGLSPTKGGRPSAR